MLSHSVSACFCVYYIRILHCIASQMGAHTRNRSQIVLDRERGKKAFLAHSKYSKWNANILIEK